jgi:ABC-type multidrug transport system permease subunit
MNRRTAFKQLFLARMREFYREPEVVFWVYIFPLLMALGLGFAFQGRTPEPGLIDLAAEPVLAEKLVAELKGACEEGGLRLEVHPLAQCKERLRVGKTPLYLVARGQEFEVVYDPTRSESVSTFYQVEAALHRWRSPTSDLRLTPVHVTEPGSRYIDFLVPGLMGMNLLGGALWGVGFAIVDLRVRKLMKRYLATPMNRADFLLSMVTARLALMIPEVLLLLGFAYFIFGVPVVGNVFVLMLVIVWSALAYDGFGLLLACRTEKTETVAGLINLFTLPMWLLSGTFFSSRRYPDVMQPFIQALPLTQTNDALREVMLEGAGLDAIAWRLGILALWGGVSFVLALRWMKWQ